MRATSLGRFGRKASIGAVAAALLAAGGLVANARGVDATHWSDLAERQRSEIALAERQADTLGCQARARSLACAMLRSAIARMETNLARIEDMGGIAPAYRVQAGTVDERVSVVSVVDRRAPSSNAAVMDANSRASPVESARPSSSTFASQARRHGSAMLAEASSVARFEPAVAISGAHSIRKHVRVVGTPFFPDP